MAEKPTGLLIDRGGVKLDGRHALREAPASFNEATCCLNAATSSTTSDEVRVIEVGDADNWRT